MTTNVNDNRIFKFDNIKGMAIIFIVFLHISAPFFEFSIYKNLGKLFTILGMGLFCFISGYFSKVDENTQIKAFKGLFIPYILFCTLYTIFAVIVLGSSFPKNLYFVPTFGLWYLLMVFYFRFSLPVLVKIKYIFWISLIAALAIGLMNFPSNFLALTRSFVYLPIFLAGYYFKNSTEYFNHVNQKIKNIIIDIRDIILNHKTVFSILLLLIIIGFFFLCSDFSLGFFGFKPSYAKLGLRRSFGMIMRLLVILFMILVSVLVTYLMPNKRTFLSKIGVNSLYIYILHIFIANFLKKLFKSHSYKFLTQDLLFATVFPIVITLILVVLLSTSPIAKLMDKLINFVTRIFIKNSNTG